MSNYHVLKQTKKKHEVEVVFHIAVPAEQNNPGKDLSDCIKEDLQPDGSLVPWLETGNPTEYANILDGTVFEIKETIKFNAGLTLVQKRNVIDAKYSSLASNVPDIIRNVYQWWGTNRDV